MGRDTEHWSARFHVVQLMQGFALPRTLLLAADLNEMC